VLFSTINIPKSDLACQKKTKAKVGNWKANQLFPIFEKVKSIQAWCCFQPSIFQNPT
jgi:hypothetical protein